MTDQQQIDRLSRLLQYREQDPTNLTLSIDIGFLQLALGQLSPAKKTAEEVIGLAPEKWPGYTLRGLVSVREGDPKTAADMLGTAIELGETLPAAFYNHAYVLANLGRYEDAEASAAWAAQHCADFPHAPALYIRVLHYLGKYTEAIAFAESLGDDVVAPRAKGMMSTLYLDAEKLEEAREAAVLALREDESDPDARTTMGLLALQDLDAANAQLEFDQALAVQKNQGRALLGKGLSKLLAGDLPEATAILEQVVTQTNLSSHLGSWHTLAWCHILQKNIPEAEKTLKKSLELDRNFSETHGGLAVVALMRGNIDSAIQSAKRAHNLDKNNFSGTLAQSFIHQVAGNAAQAAVFMDKFLTQQILPDGSSVQSLLIARMARADKPQSKTTH